MNEIYWNELNGSDSEKLSEAMSIARKKPGTQINLPENAVITLTGERARAAQRSVMNGDFGVCPQLVMFSPEYEYDRGIDFSGQSGTTLRGHNTTLLIDGFMEPVSIRDCKNITLEGIIIDHKRRPYTDGVISEKRPDGSYLVTLTEDIYEKTPMSLRPVIYDENKEMLLWDKVRGDIRYEDNRHVSFEADEDYTGFPIYFPNTFHSRPAIMIESAENTKISRVTIHSNCGMGLLANRTENIHIDALRVVPAEGKHFSTNTDAVHITSCKGEVIIENSEFAGQGDDSLNIHTYYHTIFERRGNGCFIRTEAIDGTHSQHPDYPDVGDKMELCRCDTLEAVGEYTVIKCTVDYIKNGAYITLDKALPDDAESCYLADITRLPSLVYRNNYCHDHCARGALVKIRSAVIENNRFEKLYGTAIELAAEASWKEGVSPSNITVTGNTIINCGRNLPILDAGGIAVLSGGVVGNSVNIHNINISANTIDCPEAKYSIFIKDADGVSVDGVHISECEGGIYAV